ncbi:2-hydroxyhepta-2,4-diene-1,7-dioate isomerase, partial [Salmonella enterica subsp. enterica serovar Florida]|nr:2-hydroxyhepta-2,4-diene-1,7-dioate isomerase [Salmonella enterica subsp. enterica serovar Florida]
MKHARVHYQGKTLNVTVDENENIILPDGMKVSG